MLCNVVAVDLLYQVVYDNSLINFLCCVCFPLISTIFCCIDNKYYTVFVLHMWCVVHSLQCDWSRKKNGTLSGILFIPLPVVCYMWLVNTYDGWCNCLFGLVCVWFWRVSYWNDASFQHWPVHNPPGCFLRAACGLWSDTYPFLDKLFFQSRVADFLEVVHLTSRICRDGAMKLTCNSVFCLPCLARSHYLYVITSSSRMCPPSQNIAQNATNFHQKLVSCVHSSGAYILWFH